MESNTASVMNFSKTVKVSIVSGYAKTHQYIEFSPCQTVYSIRAGMRHLARNVCLTKIAVRGISTLLPTTEGSNYFSVSFLFIPLTFHGHQIIEVKFGTPCHAPSTKDINQLEDVQYLDV